MISIMLSPDLCQMLDRLEAHYGVPERPFPGGVFESLIWWHCGYPPSEVACAKGWTALRSLVNGDFSCAKLLQCRKSRLASALKHGGLIPAIRAQRIREIALSVQHRFNGDLDRALGDLPLPDCREVLTGFPGIGRPGADRLMLFGEIAPVAAVPSNSPFVVVRMLYGKREQKYDAQYRLAQQAIEAAVPETFTARQRAYLLLKRHAQELCKSTKPKCAICPITSICAMTSQPD